MVQKVHTIIYSRITADASIHNKILALPDVSLLFICSRFTLKSAAAVCLCEKIDNRFQLKTLLIY